MLTREYIMNLEAGREMDMRVSEYIFGWSQCTFEGHMNKLAYGKPPEFNEDDPRVRIPDYSSSISSAWQIIEKMKDGENISLYTDNNEKWACEINYWNVDDCDTVQEAICKSALLNFIQGEDKNA